MTRTTFIFALMVSFFLSSFNGNTQLIPAGVNISGKASSHIIKTKKVSAGVTTFQKEELQLTIPAGWRSVNPDSTSPERLRLGLMNMIALTNDKGDFAWLRCDKRLDIDDPSKPMEDDLTKFSPLNEHMKTTLIKGDGPDMAVYTWKAYELSKGQKQSYTIFTGYRAEPTFRPGSGVPRLFVKCTAEDLSGVIEKDVISMAEHLQVYQESGKTSQDKYDKKTKKAVGNIDYDKMVKNILANIDYNKILTDAKTNIYRRDSLLLNWSKSSPKDVVSGSSWHTRSYITDYNKVKEIKSIVPDYLIITYSEGIANLFNTRTQTLAWSYVTYGKQECFFASANESAVFLVRDSEPDTLHAFSLNTGKELWSTRLLMGKPQAWLTIDKYDLLVAANQDKKSTILTAFDCKTGIEKWKISRDNSADFKNPPLPVQIANNILLFCDGAEAVSPDKGTTNWKKTDIQMNKKSPIPQISADTIFYLDRSNTLYLLDAKTGNTFLKSKLNSSAEYSNICPAGGNTYLRGRIKEDNDVYRYFIEALNNSKGGVMWTYSDSIPTLSNIIENGPFLYAANYKGLLALRKDSGQPEFNTELSEVGKAYRVGIRNYGKTIVYIGEMVIAGVDATTGKLRYRYACDPISQLLNLDAVDNQTVRLSKYLSHFGSAGKQGMTLSSGISDYLFDLSRASQESATLLSRAGEKSYTDYKSSGYRSDYYKSETAFLQSRIENAAAQAQFSMAAAAMTVEGVSTSIAQFTAPERQRLAEMTAKRRFLEQLYDIQEKGDYAVRGNQSEKGFSFEIIHLPSGKVVHQQNIKTERSLKEDNQVQKIIIDPDRNSFYFHELRPLPDGEPDKDDPSKFPHAMYLVAVSLPRE